MFRTFYSFWAVFLVFFSLSSFSETGAAAFSFSVFPDENRFQTDINANKMISEDSLSEADYVLGSSNRRHYLSADEPVYINGEHAHKAWGIYRVAGIFRRKEPTSSMVALRKIAAAVLVSTENKISKLRLVSQRQEIQPNDIVLPDTHMVPALFSAEVNAPEIENIFMYARILGSVGDGDFAVAGQSVVLDRGINDRVYPGMVFHLIESGAVVYGEGGAFSYRGKKDAERIFLPDIFIGSVTVIQSYQYLSLAVINFSLLPVTKQLVAVSSPPDFPEDE
ncbi:hypothetical protein CSW98_16330 [Vibrio sp. HA2012]|uniref:hypothetical protein n=1 Tax=Vibrio sp. HA2012 TaxID=1971595 RepID=UPI000C2CB3E8|nr:hypothetical protein [Vibrio sp. HA2012]PJC85161.1 hypothetical protein CSW98_16330 [Vibrio sp. HA2012]